MQTSSALQAHSPLNQPIVHLTVVVMAIMFAIMMLVGVLVVFASIRYRSREGEGEPEQNFGNSKLELSWTILPLLLLVAIFVLTVMTMRASDPPTGDSAQQDPPPDIVVVGHQYWWEFQYPGAKFITANELHIPVGKRMLLRLESMDVIHDFWVPELGRKMDVIPGHPNEMYFEATDPGRYYGTCAEFCGDEHAWMRLLVIAQPESEFNDWVAQQQKTPPAPTEDSAQEGAQLFRDGSCAQCHSIRGVSMPRIGPDLTHLASRETLAAGRLPNTPANLEAWLHDPNRYKPGSFMPNASLSPHDLTALVAYLETLR